MKIHHLNCMSFRAFKIPEITHVLLIDSADGLILIDSGLGLDDFVHPNWVEWLAIFSKGVTATPDETPFRQVMSLGLDVHQVRDIVPTHLHFDHFGGAVDFPWATVHVWDVEYRAGLNPKGWKSFFGYIPERLKKPPNIKLYSLTSDHWFGLEAIPVIRRTDVEIWLVPLVGHSPGMCGVAIKTDSGWIWHCGDAYARPMQVDPGCSGTAFPRIARGIESALFPVEARRKIKLILAEHGDEVRTICSHDAGMFFQMKQLQLHKETLGL
jgi:glyoxylase-like metal-dependent hydrolase (beta-lactamase superfamily II)